MKFNVIRTDKADSLIRQIVFYIAETFGKEVALERLKELERDILALGDNPYVGVEPRYMVLRRQGYRVLITKMDLVFYKIDEKTMTVTVCAVVEQRQDYKSIIKGM